MNIVIPGWKVTTTDWNQTDGASWRGYVLSGSNGDKFFGTYRGVKDDAAFEAAVRAKAAALS